MPDEQLTEKLMQLLQDKKVKEFVELTREAGLPGQTRESTVETMLRDIREAHTEREVKGAISWTLRYLKPLIRHDPKTEDPRIYFARYAANKESRARGWTTSPDGFIITRSLFVERFALFYIETILDEGIRDDESRMWAIIDASTRGAGKHGLMHPELLFLVSEHQELEIWIHGDMAHTVE